MTGNSDIRAELLALIERSLQHDGRVQIGWLIQEVVTSWAQPSGPDAEKWLHCAYTTVRGVARQLARAKKDEDTDDEQLVLDGFEKLHRWYPIGGELIRAEDLTSAQVLEIIAEINRTITGARIHINELQRLLDEVILPREAAAS